MMNLILCDLVNYSLIMCTIIQPNVYHYSTECVPLLPRMCTIIPRMFTIIPSENVAIFTQKMCTAICRQVHPPPNVQLLDLKVKKQMQFTCIVYVQTAKLQFNTLEIFSKGFMIMADGFLLTPTKWQGKISVSLLSVMVWSHCIHPQNHLLFFIILREKRKRSQ